MARLWMDGFEHQQAHNYIVATGASLGWDTGRRGYGKSVKASYSHISVNSNGVLSLNLPTVEQRAEVFVRLAVYYASSLSTATVKFLNSLNETICSLTLPITANSDIVVKNRADQQIGTHFLANPAVWLLIQGISSWIPAMVWLIYASMGCKWRILAAQPAAPPPSTKQPK